MIPATVVITLKDLALLTLGKDHVLVSSGELAERLGMSQQSASRHLVLLADEGAIRRELRGRKQKITLTPKGYSVLKDEFTEYARIFEEAGSLTFEGNLVGGVGD